MSELIVYDTMVVGGGPAGLTAALQLARFNRRVVLFDPGGGRSGFHQTNHNYLGFPGGIAAREIVERGREQLREYPVARLSERVVSMGHDNELFRAITDADRHFLARSAVLATGVRDHFPIFPEWQSYVGRSLFWCITCDGYSTRGKRVVVVGNDTDAGVTTMQFTLFTRRLTLLTNSAVCGLSDQVQAALSAEGIPVVVGEIARVDGDDGVLGQIVLKDGRCLPLDYLFSMQGQSPNSELASMLGAEVDGGGYVVTDEDQQTRIAGLFAAGDVTRMLAHQISTAVHEGNTAAQAANYYLYAPQHRHETYA